MSLQLFQVVLTLRLCFEGCSHPPTCLALHNLQFFLGATIRNHEFSCVGVPIFLFPHLCHSCSLVSIFLLAWPIWHGVFRPWFPSTNICTGVIWSVVACVLVMLSNFVPVRSEGVCLLRTKLYSRPKQKLYSRPKQTNNSSFCSECPATIWIVAFFNPFWRFFGLF